jgi:hypothetical protein
MRCFRADECSGMSKYGCRVQILAIFKSNQNSFGDNKCRVIVRHAAILLNKL